LSRLLAHRELIQLLELTRVDVAILVGIELVEENLAQSGQVVFLILNSGLGDL